MTCRDGKRQIIGELKAVKASENVHFAQVRSYLGVTDLRVGLLIKWVDDILGQSFFAVERSIDHELLSVRTPAAAVLRNPYWAHFERAAGVRSMRSMCAVWRRPVRLRGYPWLAGRTASLARIVFRMGAAARRGSARHFPPKPVPAATGEPAPDLTGLARKNDASSTRNNASFTRRCREWPVRGR